jgi:diguanylate cyclase (GGDEF)-like protein
MNTSFSPFLPAGQLADKHKAMNFLASPEKKNRTFWTIAGFALIGGVGVLDFLTGYELAFSLFYLIPVSLLAWLVSQRLGIMASVASACVWLAADVAAGSLYSKPFIYVWNTFVRLSFFIITAYLLSTLRRTLEYEKESARTDYLTGAANSRLFYDLVQMEIGRFQRYERPFTVAIFDLDNFKSVNDRFGHSVGDQVLRSVVGSTNKFLRKTDMIARLGGDEFALLLPETGQEPAGVVLAKIQGGLLEEMRQSNWPITFSIGVLTCNAAPPALDEVVRMTDDLMYSVKRKGKNAIRYSTYPG